LKNKKNDSALVEIGICVAAHARRYVLYFPKEEKMGNEVLEFAEKVGAIDLKAKLEYSEYHGLFKRRNYFLIGEDKFLTIKISRSKIRPFWGLGKKFFDFFNMITEESGNYFFVALVSNKSGWVISKNEFLSQISDKSISYSEKQAQYKINNYNIRDHYGFTSTEDFLLKIGVQQ
jgi:hypothetical protein